MSLPRRRRRNCRTFRYRAIRPTLFRPAPRTASRPVRKPIPATGASGCEALSGQMQRRKSARPLSEQRQELWTSCFLHINCPPRRWVAGTAYDCQTISQSGKSDHVFGTTVTAIRTPHPPRPDLTGVEPRLGCRVFRRKGVLLHLSGRNIRRGFEHTDPQDGPVSNPVSGSVGMRGFPRQGRLADSRRGIGTAQNGAPVEDIRNVEANGWPPPPIMVRIVRIPAIRALAPKLGNACPKHSSENAIIVLVSAS